MIALRLLTPVAEFDWLHWTRSLPGRPKRSTVHGRQRRAGGLCEGGCAPDLNPASGSSGQAHEHSTHRAVGPCLVLGLLLALGCSGTGANPDSHALDQAADFLSDSPADLSFSDSPPGDATTDGARPAGAALSGRLLDEQDAPVPKVMLILCGNLHGVELCNQQFSATDGTFAFSGLSQGYDHLQVLPYPSFHETGKPYCGMVLPIELPAPGDLLDLGDLDIPLAETTTPFVVATGGDVAFSRLSVHIQPDSLSFPGLEDEAAFGIARVAPEDAPFAPPWTIEAFSFHPFACGLTAPATVRYTPDGIGPLHIILLSNSMDTGALVPLASHVDGDSVVAEVSELTWIVVLEAL